MEIDSPTLVAICSGILEVCVNNKNLTRTVWVTGEYSYNNSRQIVLGGSTGVDSQGRYIIAGVDPDDSLNVLNFDGQSAYQINLGFKYSF